MADLFNSIVPSLVAGVSQQSDAQRDPTQAEIQLNGVSSVVEGLRKREGAQLLARIDPGLLGDVTIHPILRDTNEKYLAVIGRNVVRVFDLEGAEHVVHTDLDGFAYLKNVVDARTDIRAVSLADYTFISNVQVKAAMDPNRLTPKQPRPFPHECLIWVKAANFGQTYRVQVNGMEAVVTTPVAPVLTTEKNGVLETIQNRVDAATIAQQIADALAPRVSGVNWRRSGSVLWLTSNNPISVGATDAQGGTDIAAITDTVQAFTDLPARGPNGYQITVEGKPDTVSDDWFIEFRVRSGQGDFGEGSWAESPASGMEYRINAKTMPHVLVRLNDGSFLFSPMDGRTYLNVTSPGQQSVKLKMWGDRTAGDYTSAPDPSFIGHAINDIFVFRNRLGFLADESVILSRPGEFFEFFPESATTTMDSDPIDIVASGSRVSVLRYAVAAQDQLILFSDQTQFRVGTDTATLTAASVSINVLTQYEIDIRVRPTQVGTSIVFCQANGEWSRFQEFRLGGNGASVTASVDDLTQQVPGYIPTGVFTITVEEASGSWYSVSDASGYQNDLYVNKFFWRNSGDGMTRMQNSWSKWEFTGISRIVQLLCLQEALYLVTEANGSTWLEKIPTTDASPRARLLPAAPLLDRWLSYSPPNARGAEAWHLIEPRGLTITPPSYDPVTKMTSWQLPFPVSQLHEAWTGLETPLGAHKLGSFSAGRTFTARGDWRHAQVIFGIPYQFRYRFTRFKPYRQEATAKVAMSATRAQIRKAMLRYHHSDFFQVAVLAEGRPEAIYTFDATQLGTRNNRIGAEQWNLEKDEATARYREGAFSIPVMGAGETTVVEIRNDTPRHCKFSSLEFVGLYHGKART